MPNTTRKLHIPRWRKPRYDKRDLILAAWSLLVHLMILLLLPQMATQAAARVELQLELVQQQQRQLPAKPEPAPSGLNPAQPQQAPEQTVETSEPEPAAADQQQTDSAVAAGAGPTTETQLDENEQDSYTMPAIPEVLATPSHQPRKITQPPVSAADPPEAVDASRSQSEPPQPDSAELPPEAAEGQPEEVNQSQTPDPRPEQAQESEPAPTPGEPSEAAEPVPGAGVPENGPPAPPPGPSALELGLLEEYGDYARKRIKMLARTPERAKEQKLKGTAEFEFEIASDGTLLKVKVISSSGQPILDEECLESTKVAAPFKRFPANIKLASWKFRMKLNFPLY